MKESTINLLFFAGFVMLGLFNGWLATINENLLSIVNVATALYMFYMASRSLGQYLYWRDVENRELD